MMTINVKKPRQIELDVKMLNYLFRVDRRQTTNNTGKVNWRRKPGFSQEILKKNKTRNAYIECALWVLVYVIENIIFEDILRS